jgi:hypothetical protein
VHPDPQSKVSLLGVEEMIHPILYAYWNIPELGVVDPVFGRIFSERNLTNAETVDLFV